MGLFKSDKDILAEGKALYIKGDLAGARLKLLKLEGKGNPEACYITAKIQLEHAEKRDRDTYLKLAKTNLEIAAKAGHKDAIALLTKKFGNSIPATKVDENLQKDIKENTEIIEKSVEEPKKSSVVDVEVASQGSGVPNESKNTSKREAMLEIIKTVEEPFKLEPVNSSQVNAVEKFIRNHNLGISLSDVIAYRDTAVFSSGKKGHILTEEFLYYSDNSKRGTKVEFAGIVSAEKARLHEFYVTYASGERKTFSNTEYVSFAEYYVKLINAFIAIEAKSDELTLTYIDNKKGQDIASIEKEEAEAKAKAESEARAKAEAEAKAKAEEEAKAKAEAEARAKAEAEAKAKAEAEAKAKAEAEAKAKAEAQARAKAEEEAKANAEAEAKANAEAEIEAAFKLYENGSKNEAIEIWRKYVNKGHLSARYYLAAGLYNIGEYEEALKWAELVKDNCEHEVICQQMDEIIDEVNRILEDEDELLVELPSVSDDDLDESYIEREIEEALEAFENDRIDEAFAVWRKYAEEGYILAMIYLAKGLADVGEYEESLELAEMLKDECEDEEICQTMVELIESIHSMEDDESELLFELPDVGDMSVERELTEIMAFKRNKSVAEQGHAEAQFDLALMYYEGEGTEKKLGEAIKWFKSAAEQGHAEAQYNLAVMYHNGEGTEKNPKEAFKWFKSAAEQGHAEAQNSLAVMYIKGEGIEKNPKEAFKWFKLAAEQGHVSAQHNLAFMYLIGEGTEKNLREAFKRFKLLAEQGVAKAQNNLAAMYIKGEGTEKNPKEAFKWFKSAAEQGEADAQNSLAVMYIKGEGTEENLEEAIKWVKAAAEQGNADAQRNLEILLKYKPDAL